MGVGWGHFLLFSLVTFQLPITQGRRGFEGAEDLTGKFSLEAAKDEGKNPKIVEKISHLPPNCVQLQFWISLYGALKKNWTHRTFQNLCCGGQKGPFLSPKEEAMFLLTKMW